MGISHLAMLFLALQIGSLRYACPASTEDGTGAFSIQASLDWKATLPGVRVSKDRQDLRDGTFVGSNGARMKILRLMKVEADVLKDAAEEIDRAAATQPDVFQPLNLRGGYHGGLFERAGPKKKSQGVWVIARLIRGQELVDVTVHGERRLKREEMDQLAMMLRTFQPEN